MRWGALPCQSVAPAEQSANGFAVRELVRGVADAECDLRAQCERHRYYSISLLCHQYAVMSKGGVVGSVSMNVGDLLLGPIAGFYKRLVVVAVGHDYSRA